MPTELQDFEEALTAEPSVPTADAIPTIYSLYYQEVRATVEDLWNSSPHLLYGAAYNRGQEKLPGLFLDAWRAWTTVELGDAFPHAYATAGASEALRELIRPGIRVNTFEGDYEGFWRLAQDRGIPFVVRPRGQCVGATYDDTDVFFLSDPSSIDGDHLDGLDSWIDEMERRHPRVSIVVDVTYVGATKVNRARDFSRHPNVKVVVFSLSKPFGVYYHRIGGVFSRNPIPVLEHGNVWFVNPFSLALGTMLMRRFQPGELPRRYAHVQEQVLADAIAQGIVPASAKAGNVILFGIGPEGDARNRRVDGTYRFCLTPGIYRHLYGESR
ncbi:MAG: hypothetical protein WCO25_05700 [Candidatus Uhrbacteria bacterium]